MHSASPKVVSLVPSWTETLLACGVHVIGRTRYCIHPEQLISNIPIIGGTKKADWNKLLEKPDLVILDREENTKEIAEACPTAFWASHILSVEDVAPQCKELAHRLDNVALFEISKRWKKINAQPNLNTTISAQNKKLPGLIKWFVEPTYEIEKYAYFVWRKPWMIVQPQTFIGSLCKKIGIPLISYPSQKLYPEVDLNWLLDQKNIGFIFSSEPYPFFNREEELKGLNPACAMVDGEKYSWFGVRALEFLESELLKA